VAVCALGHPRLSLLSNDFRKKTPPSGALI
jgi:hypothetical protein